MRFTCERNHCVYFSGHRLKTRYRSTGLIIPAFFEQPPPLDPNLAQAANSVHQKQIFQINYSQLVCLWAGEIHEVGCKSNILAQCIFVYGRSVIYFSLALLADILNRKSARSC